MASSSCSFLRSTSHAASPTSAISAAPHHGRTHFKRRFFDGRSWSGTPLPTGSSSTPMVHTCLEKAVHQLELLSSSSLEQAGVAHPPFCIRTGLASAALSSACSGRTPTPSGPRLPPHTEHTLLGGPGRLFVKLAIAVLHFTGVAYLGAAIAAFCADCLGAV